MPLGLFLPLAGRLVPPCIGRSDTQIGDRPPILSPFDFWIGPEIADQNHLVYASRHRRSPLSKITGLAGHLSFWLEPPGIVLRFPWDHFEPTLYARRSRKLAIPWLSTYSIPRSNVP